MAKWYITIDDSMFDDPRMTTAEDLLLYGYIYGFSQDGESECKTGFNRLCKKFEKFIGSRTTMNKHLQTLLDCGLVEKRDRGANKGNAYWAVGPRRDMQKEGSTENGLPQKMDQYNNCTTVVQKMDYSSPKNGPQSNNTLNNSFNKEKINKKEIFLEWLEGRGFTRYYHNQNICHTNHKGEACNAVGVFKWIARCYKQDKEAPAIDVPAEEIEAIMEVAQYGRISTDDYTNGFWKYTQQLENDFVPGNKSLLEVLKQRMQL